MINVYKLKKCNAEDNGNMLISVWAFDSIRLIRTVCIWQKIYYGKPAIEVKDRSRNWVMSGTVEINS